MVSQNGKSLTKLSPVGEVNLVRHHCHDLKQLPPPQEPWYYDDVSAFISRSLFAKIRDWGLIRHAGDGKEPMQWRTSERLWCAVDYFGVERGSDRCGVDGPLPCGSRRFVNVGDGLQCKTCERVYDRAEVVG